MRSGSTMATNDEVRILTHDEYPLWDALTMKSPQGTIFHSSKWISTCAELSLKKECLYGFFKNNDLVAGCAIYSDKKYLLLPTAISTAPLTPYGGYIFSPIENTKVRENEQFRNMIISRINTELTKEFDYINIVHSPSFSDIRPFAWDGWNSSIQYTYYFNLENNIEGSISKKVRNTIRKSQKFGIILKKESDPDLYYHLMIKTYEKQHLAQPVSKNFLIKMIDMIISNNLGEMWIARTPNGEPAAAEIVIWDAYRAHRWSAASDAQFKDTGATSHLLFEIFQDLQKRGFHEINLMAGNTPQLTKFISSFNPRLVPYYCVEKMDLKYYLLKWLYNNLMSKFK